jgi:DNA-binding NtrC family response regulator
VTVLVVEDQREVRKLAVLALTAAGFSPLEAGNATEALTVISRRKGRIDLLLTDVVMPGMSGRDLAVQVAAQYPDIAVLFMSGYSEELVAPGESRDPGFRYLAKPFSPDQLTAAVRAALQARRPRRQRILIVDDTAAVRELFAAMLAGAGYEVAEAGDVRSAVELLAGGKFDLLITDLLLPDSTDVELIRAARRAQPRMKIIAVSGSFGAVVPDDAGRLGVDAALGKPVSREELLGAVKNVLQSEN